MPRPNILLVTVDSLRLDHVTGEYAATPTLDQLAQRGQSCGSAIAQGPFTTFSMPSLFTSRYPSQLTGIDFVEGVQGVLVGNKLTVQQHLSEEGYTTAGIHSNPLLSRLFGFDVGFDHFADGVQDMTGRLPERLLLLVNKLHRLVSRTAYTPAEDLTDAALEWLSASPDEPWFLWVHYMDVHGPYQSTHGGSYVEKFRAEWLWRRAVRSPEEITPREHARLRSAYVDEIEYVDGEICRLVESFGDAGNGVCVAVTADHGEEFREHGSYSHEGKLYDELLRVPLIIDPPQGVDVTFRDVPTPLLDLAPTLVDIGGGTMTEAEGRSMVAGGGNPNANASMTTGAPSDSDRLQSERRDDQSEHRGVVSEATLSPKYTACVRTEDWKYLTSPSSTALFDLQDDPGETDDVSEYHPSVVERLEARLTSHRERFVEDADERGEVALDSGAIDEQLRRLGYLE